MKVAVVGSRGITEYHEVENAIRGSPWAGDSSPYHWDMEIISGGADGVDSLAEAFAENYGLPTDVRDPNWGDWSHGHPALTRNTEIVEEADAVIEVWYIYWLS